MFACCCCDEDVDGTPIIVPVRNIKNEVMYAEDMEVEPVDGCKVEEVDHGCKLEEVDHIEEASMAQSATGEEEEEKRAEQEPNPADSYAFVPQAAGPFAFEVTIEKACPVVGLGADMTHRGLRVLDIVPGGSIAKHNEAAEDARKLQPNDFIMEVNGLKADKEMENMVAQLKSREASAVKVVRPTAFRVSVRREGKSMGVSVGFNPGSSLADICTIDAAGAVYRHNQTAPEELRIRESDLVDAVRAGDKLVTDSAEGIARALKTWSEETFEMKLLRLRQRVEEVI